MKNKTSKKQLREFGLLIGFAFPIMIGYFIPLIHREYFKVWTLFISIPFLTLGIFKPNQLLYPYKAWMKIGLILGWINSRLILGLVFLLVLLPISLIMRLLGYDPLKIKNIKKNSYREDKINHKIDLNKLF